MDWFIPFDPEGTTKGGLKDAIDEASRKCDMAPLQGAVFMSYFFEAVVKQLCFGKAVGIPGFGKFMTYPWQPQDGSPIVASPRFIAARPFKNEIEFSSAPTTKMIREHDAYRTNHHRTKKHMSPTNRTFSAMKNFRSRLAVQARARHLDLVM